MSVSGGLRSKCAQAAIASGKATFGKWSRKILRLSPASVHRQRSNLIQSEAMALDTGVNFPLVLPCTTLPVRNITVLFSYLNSAIQSYNLSSCNRYNILVEKVIIKSVTKSITKYNKYRILF